MSDFIERLFSAFLLFLSSLSSATYDLIKPYFKEQVLTASKILYAFIEHSVRLVLLRAQMQSGKTGIFLRVAFYMLHTNRVKRVVIVCGSNDNELHAQLVDSRNDRLLAYMEEQTELTVHIREREISFLRERVEVYKSNDFHKIPLIGKDTLLIWDESHYAQGEDNLPFQYLKRSGLPISGSEASEAAWSAKNSYYLSVSATPFAQFADAKKEEYEIGKIRTIITHVPSADYRGVKYYSDRGLIRPSFTIKTTPEKFTALLAERAGQRKYALVRSNNLEIIRECCAGAGVAFKEYHRNVKKIKDLDELKNAPEQFTVIGIKGMCRMGKVVPSQHISFAFEDTKKSNSDAVLQSFLGRLCGHGPYPAEDPIIFVPPSFLKPDKTMGSDLERYLQFVAGEDVLPKDFSCSKKGPAVSGRFVLPPIFVSVKDADEEEFGEASALASMTDAQRRSFCVPKARSYIEKNPYKDSLQQAEVLDRLIDSAACVGIHDPDSISYKGLHDKLKEYHATGKRFDDSWRPGQPFKIYWTAEGFYLVGQTETAEKATELICKGAIPATTSREVYSTKHDAVIVMGGAGGPPPE